MYLGRIVEIASARRSLPRAAAPLHAGAAVGGAGGRPGGRASAPAHRGAGRSAQRAEARRRAAASTPAARRPWRVAAATTRRCRTWAPGGRWPAICIARFPPLDRDLEMTPAENTVARLKAEAKLRRAWQQLRGLQRRPALRAPLGPHGDRVGQRPVQHLDAALQPALHECRLCGGAWARGDAGQSAAGVQHRVRPECRGLVRDRRPVPGRRGAQLPARRLCRETRFTRTSEVVAARAGKQSPRARHRDLAHPRAGTSAARR